MGVLAFIKAHLLSTMIAIMSAIAVGVIVTIAIVNSNEEGEMTILEAGISDIPAIKNDDLQELGKLYSELNDEFEREIDTLVSGIANRKNKRGETLDHYGIYGKENKDPFKNDDYVNGINIKYEKISADIPDGKSNFNDILAVMSVLYDQKMDTISIGELKSLFTDMFWLSHTFTFDSTELYPCKHGCAAVNSYKCKDVYKDYDGSDLQYDPFTVRKHDEYESLLGGKSYLMDEDFRYVYPEGQCEVCGTAGAGCIWDDTKTCYHGSGSVTLSSCDATANTIGSIVYGEIGESVIPIDVDSQYLGGDDTKGNKISKTDSNCNYYKIVKFCSIRKDLAEQIDEKTKALETATETASEHSSTCTYSGAGECTTCKDNEENVTKLDNELKELTRQLETHVTNECEASELGKKYWCDGYKVCLGHKTHYKCPGHKLVVCFGHTNINVAVKILYRDELLDAAYNSLE